MFLFSCMLCVHVYVHVLFPYVYVKKQRDRHKVEMGEWGIVTGMS